MKKPIGLACALILGIAGSALYRATLPSLSVRTSSVPQEGPSKVARPMQGNGSRPTHWPVGVLVGAGDIADCANLRGAEATAKLLDRIPGTVFTVGDVVYPRGSDSDLLTVTRRLGAVTKRARAPQSATESTVQRTPPVIFDTSARRRVSPGKATTATISVPGTSWSSTAIACESAAAEQARRRSNGCAATWPRIARPARWPTGIIRCSARASSPDTQCAQKCELSGKRSMKWARKSS